MTKTNETLGIDDLVRPLSLEAVVYFASGEIPKAKERDNALSGKFIRIGEVMLFGTTIYYGKPDWQGDLDFLKHRELIDYFGLHYEELTELGQRTETGEPLLDGILNDAGSSWIRVDSDGQPTGLELDGQSMDFGRADELGRQRSIETAQKLVGQSIVVTTRN